MPYTDILRTKGWSENIGKNTLKARPPPNSHSSLRLRRKYGKPFLVMQVINSHKITRVFTPFTETNQHVKCLHLKLTFSPLIR